MKSVFELFDNEGAFLSQTGVDEDFTALQKDLNLGYKLFLPLSFIYYMICLVLLWGVYSAL